MRWPDRPIVFMMGFSSALALAVVLAGGTPSPLTIIGLAFGVIYLILASPREEQRSDEIRVETAREIVRWISHIDRLDEIPGAKVGLPKYNPLWDAAVAIEREFAGDEKRGPAREWRP